MASLCKRQQCTIERRGFRQELDSWRHKLIHCVGFESILEGLLGPGLVKDITLFQDCEPEGVLDWSFDVNCLFCCLRREKVKEHLVGITPQVLSESEDLKQDTSKINRLEKQAEEFLNAVFYRKADLPSFSDPHIPLVAREIMQRMIRQFAAEYTSKNSYSQDTPHHPQPNGIKDQSLLLPRAASLAPAPLALPGPSSPTSPTPGPGLSPASASASAPDSGNGAGSNCSGTSAAASAQNPVLSKLLMADQDSPLDLTIKKPDATETKTEDGVLDLSTKKAHGMAGTVLKDSHSYTLSPTVKGRALRVEHAFRDVEDDDIMLPRSLQDGLSDSYVSSATLKPPLARSLLIKAELLSQKHRLLGQPPALSLASLEAAGLLNHGNKGNHVQPHPLLARDGSPWGSSSGKAPHHQLDSLLRLKQASAILSDLKDLPLLLDNHQHGALSSKSSSGGGLHQHSHRHGSTKTHHISHHEVVVKREPGGHHSPPVDLKIPQVRGMDLSWDSHASDLYGYGAMVVGDGGHGGVENALSRKLRAILPKQNRRAGGGSLRGSLGVFLDGAADYWSSDVDQGTSGPPYPTSDPEGDPGSKQPRKKRGRYRQYNSQILEEAIGMVMGGKMSVSKAQNMYGIPHSTLEYKVKERLGTLKNPPKKKLKLTMRMGGQDSAAESETTPTATPREDVLPGAADLNHEQKMKMEFED